MRIFNYRLNPDGQQFISLHQASGCRCACGATNSRRRTSPLTGTITKWLIAGRAELETEGQTVRLEAGDSWVVPAGAEHTYQILETFTAVESTAPPAQVHDRTGPERRQRSITREGCAKIEEAAMVAGAALDAKLPGQAEI